MHPYESCVHVLSLFKIPLKRYELACKLITIQKRGFKKNPSCNDMVLFVVILYTKHGYKHIETDTKNRRNGEVGGGTLYLNVEYVRPRVPTNGM